MGAGYVRQSSADIQTGKVVLAAPLNNEFNALQSAFDGSTGHSHDGTTGEGQKINLTTSVTGTLPLGNGGTGGTDASTARTSLGLGTATQNIGTSGATVPLLNTTNTWSATQVFDTGSSNTRIQIDGTTAVDRILGWRSSGVQRWAIFATSGTESGSNVGSNISFARYSDAGSFIDNPLQINRSTGVTTLSILNLTTPLAATQGGTGVTSSTGSGSNVLSTSPTLVTPNLGTPSAVTLTNGTGLPISTGVSGLGTNVATFLATPTSANLAAALTDETGSGAAVFATSPTLTTPTIGAATATSVNKITITTPATGATLTLTDGTTLTQTTSTSIGRGQYQGTNTNDNATAGNIGEYVQSEVASGSAVATTSNTAVNITSISLTAGDWDVWGNVFAQNGSGTSALYIIGAISTVSTSLPTAPNGGGYNQNTGTIGSNGTQNSGLVMKRLSLSTTTTVYLISYSNFSGGTQACFGGIYARRVR